MRPVFDPSAVHHLKHKGAVDADGHVLEDAGLWDHYIEAKYRDRALRMKRDAQGLEYLEIGGLPSKRTRKGYPATLGRMGQKDLDAFTPHPDKTYAANMPYGACNAQERLKLLDAEGLDAAVLYPTLGILWEAELSDVELSQAYCRAYNRWIADFCRELKGRLIPIAHLSLGDPAAAAARARARGEGRLPRRLRRALRLDAQAARRPGARCDFRQSRRARRADRHPSRLRAFRAALAALRERPSPVAARRGDGRRRRPPGLHHLLRLRDLRSLSQIEARAAGIGRRLDRLLARPAGRRGDRHLSWAAARP